MQKEFTEKTGGKHTDRYQADNQNDQPEPRHRHRQKTVKIILRRQQPVDRAVNKDNHFIGYIKK